MNELTIIKNNSLEVNKEPFKINNDLLNEFLSFMGNKKTTSETYIRCIRQFINWTIDNDVVIPTREDIIAYRDHIRSYCKPSTVQTYLIALKQLYKWIEEKGYSKDVAKNVKKEVKINREFKKDYFTTSQIKEIINQEELNIRDKTIISLAVSGGLRTIEISRANIEDIRNLGDRSVLYIQGKGRDEKTEYIEITAPLEKLIREYLKTRKNPSPKDPLFTSGSNRNAEGRLTTRSISRLIKEAYIRAGYNSEKLTAHSLRHTTATLNLLNGASIEETQAYLRHADISTTMIYSHHIDRIKNTSADRLSGLIFE